jgi:hypothetical protein
VVYRQTERNEALILRRVPMFLSTVTYPGTTVVKEVVIDVFRRSVKREEVADRDGFAFIAAAPASSV